MLIRKSHIVTLNVLYYLPDYEHIIQEFIWSFDDYVPELQRTHKFLNYWKSNIDAIIKEILLAVDGNNLERLRKADWMLTLN